MQWLSQVCPLKNSLKSVAGQNRQPVCCGYAHYAVGTENEHLMGQLIDKIVQVERDVGRQAGGATGL